MLKSTTFRNYPGTNPSTLAKRSIAHRLQHIKHKVLGHFKPTDERHIMRQTLEQLLDRQPTMEGKIERMMDVVGGIEVLRGDWEQTQDSFSQWENRNYRRMRVKDVRGGRKESYLHDASHKADLTSTNIDQIDPPSCSQIHQSSPSLLTSLTHHPQHNKYARPSPLTDYLYNRNHQPSSGSFLSFTDKADAIDQKDIFSFRTQGNGSPVSVRKSPQGREPFYHREIIYSDHSKGSRSGEKLSRSGKKKSNSPVQSLSKFNRKISYDGKSFSYLRQLNQSSSFIEKRAHKKTKGEGKKGQLTPSKLNKRIANRIRLSAVVVDPINHSNDNSDQNYLQNRYKHDQQARSSLVQDIVSAVTCSHRWQP